MKRLNLEDYDYTVPELDSDGKITEKILTYDVRKAIEGILLASGPGTTQRLSNVELLRNARIAQKITMAKDGFVLLEEAEFQIVKQSFDALRGYGKNDVECVKRIENAETVDVEEKKKPKS